MRKIRIKITMALLILAGAANFEIMAEEISSIETSGSWVYLYNAQGKKYKSFSASSVGRILGYSSSFFVAENGSWIYLYNADGKRYKSMSKSSVGEILGVAGDTFTSRSGSWIYTWNKDGKRISSRFAR